MRTEATRKFVQKLRDLADDYEVWPDRRAKLDALEAAIGKDARIGAVFERNYRDAATSVVEAADQVARTAPQAASVGSYAIGEYEEAEHYATLGLNAGR
ncbi:hypothetical protein Acsp02_73440 [Actinoplanes sp. NBRC 103695]|nr:hypothetical protein Acsp02_73440 [Actinoplanes sp. NBRC 103695]